MSIINNSNDPGENRRTVIAVALSVVVITLGFWIQGTFFPAAQKAPVPAAANPTPSTLAPAATMSPAAPGLVTAEVPAAKPSASAPKTTTGKPAIAVPLAERTYTIDTDLLEAVLTNKGGELISLKLRKHKDNAGYVDLFIPGTPDVKGFAVSFGNETTPPMRELMNAKMVDTRTIEFSRTLYASSPGKAEPTPITYKKRFKFNNGEYLFGLAITLENSENLALPLNQDGTAYSLAFGPRIGPSVAQMGQNTDQRKILTYANGKRKDESQKNQPWNPASQPSWSAISGKYFAFVAIPQLVNYKTTFTQSQPGPTQTTAMSFARPAVASAAQTDTWYFYFGPKTNADLAKYDYADRNGFQLQGMQLENVLDNANILKWLEDILKFVMNFFYGLIPNYGVAIILLTILVKLIMFPLSRKSSMASARMQELQPKMQEIQAKHKGNPQKMNQEMAEFYKKEGYNPMSGCLPLLVQFPLFIAMYNLFNTHFDLRGASFIMGWIPDLSMPESVWNFGEFRIPLLGWNDLRLLPILYVGSQLLYGKFTQMPQTGQSASQMKIMMYGMPIMFFFILYDVPSGLLVYWIAQNILTIGQQIVINDYIKKHKAKRAAASEPVIAPKKHR